MELFFSNGSTPRLDRLLAVAGDMLEHRSHGVSVNSRGEITLTCAVPPGWKPRTVLAATHLKMRIADGNLFDFSETERGHSGGFIGSCIPVPLLCDALAAWIADKPAAPALPAQLDLFGAITV